MSDYRRLTVPLSKVVAAFWRCPLLYYYSLLEVSITVLLQPPGGVHYCTTTAWCPPHRVMVLASLVTSQPLSSLVGNVDAVKVLQSVGNVKCHTLDDSLLLQKWKFSVVSNQECFEWALCTDEDTRVSKHTLHMQYGQYDPRNFKKHMLSCMESTPRSLPTSCTVLEITLIVSTIHTHCAVLLTVSTI